LSFWEWVFLGGIILVLVAVLQTIELGNKKKSMEDKLKAIPDFTATQKVMGCDGNTALAVDEQRKKICLITKAEGINSYRVFSYLDLFSVEIFEDGTSVTKTERGSQIGGALVGGILLGGVGAIMGGLSGSKETSQKIKRIDLRLRVNDTKNPLHEVRFLNRESTKDAYAYKEAIKSARHWHGLAEVLIKRADMEEKAKRRDRPQITQNTPSASVADEISKLAELHKAGVITLEEFKQQKKILFSSNNQQRG